MGREIKRVALDFNWPLNKVWEGYLNPHYEECPYCHHGSTAARRELQDRINHLMWDSESRLDNVVSFKDRREWLELTSGLAGRKPFNGQVEGHDSCDAWVALGKVVEAAGLPDDWGWCKHCGGSGIAPETREACEAWEKTEPPRGEGWQVWETVTEGSPVSPVFPTADELFFWLVNDQGYSRKAAEGFITVAWVPSLIMEVDDNHTCVASYKDIEAGELWREG